MILLNVLRALYYVFKLVFCNWRQKKEEHSLEYFIKDRQVDNSSYFNEVRKSTMRRQTVKKTTQEQLVDQVDDLWKKVQESLGKYGKVIDFIATQRKNIYGNLISATRGGKALDIVEKYLVFKSLHCQIQELKKKALVQPFIKRPTLIKSSYSKDMNYGQYNYGLQESLIPMGSRNQAAMGPSTSVNSSFDELQLEDSIDDMYMKWSISKDICDQFFILTPNNSEQFLPNCLLTLMVELYKNEISSQNKEPQFESFLKDLSGSFTSEDLKYLNKVKELIYKSEIECYEQKMATKQKELEELQQEAIHKIVKLEEDTQKVRVKFQETGQFEKYEKIRDENGHGHVIIQNNNDTLFENFEHDIEKQQTRIDLALNDLKQVRMKQREEEERNQECLKQMQSELAESRKILVERFDFANNL